MNYSEMSDFEINREVAGKVGGFLAKDIFEEEQTIFKWHPGNKYSKFDPCNSWADAGPIIDANKIAMIPETDGTWFALGNPQIKNNWRVESTGAFHNDTTPLRAAMIVFLMMQEKTNA